LSMKIVPKTQKDFDWVNFTPKQIREYTLKTIKKIDEDVKKIKNIKKEDRTFENTVMAIENIGEHGTEDSPLSFLNYVSTDAKVRNASKEYQEKISKKAIDVSFDKELYSAFLEYDPKSEKLLPEELRLWHDTKTGFEDNGFHLPEKKQLQLKEISKRLTDLGIKFSKNINDYHAEILCSDEELKGLPQNYISNLKVDKKTGKKVVTLAYPEYGPFMKFADNEKKRKELADLQAEKGGRENIKILKEMLKLRKKYAEVLGYKSFAHFEAKDAIAKSAENIRLFLETTIKNLKKITEKDHNKFESYVSQNFPGKKLSYYNSSYYANKMRESLFSYDENEVKEYFELKSTTEKMFAIFGKLFGVTFKENRAISLWHKDAQMFDVVEKGKVVGHIGLDLFPRPNKYSHMACWPLMPGKSKSFRSEEYLAPVNIIVGNFPIGTKENPSLLSIGEIVTLFHEFGHVMHGVLSRAKISSQSGSNVLFDFIETPSQLFENWVRDKKNLKFISNHYKTGKKIKESLLDKVVESLNFMKAGDLYYQFILALQDHEMHSDKWNTNPLKLDKEFDKRYFKIPRSPKSLFPASWGHMVGYAGKYYSYMWSLVYSYDIFSRFKKEGILNKDVGMELRHKILEKGDTKDPLLLIKDFLGRKPNNKEFLKSFNSKN
jgi:thimet oligopeptidase